MALNRKSKMKETFDNVKANAILVKHVPACLKDDPRMAPAMGMTVQALISFPASKCPKDVREAFFSELEAANLE